MNPISPHTEGLRNHLASIADHAIGKHTKLWRLAASALLGLTVSGSPSLQAQTETVIPQEYTSGMRNPLMGFREGQRSGTPGQKDLAAQAAGKLVDLSAHPYSVLIRDYIHYNVLENSAADTVQKIKNYSNAAWANYETKNIKVIPRVILLYTADQTPSQAYWPSDLTQNDWTSQAVRDRVVAMVRKMGEAWNDDPRVAWVHVGLIGQWGEQESPVGIDQDLGGGVTWAKILEPVFKEVFPNKMVLVRSPEKWGNDYDLGMYWDTYSANGKMNDPVDEWGRVKFNNKAPREVYKKAPVEGEVAYGTSFAIPAQMGTDEDATMQNANYRQFFIDTVRSVNGTTVGIEYDPKIAANTAGAAEVQKAFGYRFLIKEFTFTKRVEPGATLTFNAKVVNDGSAPTYANWPLSVVLIDEATKQIVWTGPATPGVDITQWLPGQNYDWNYVDGGFGTGSKQYLTPAPVNQVNGSVTIPTHLAAGSYLVGLSILDPTTMQPGIFFSTTHFLQASNSQPLGRIGIGANAGSGPITFDPYNFLNDTRRYNLTPVGSVVTVTAPDPLAAESGDTGTFTFRRTGTNGISLPLTVNYTLSGTAINGTDYTGLAGSVTIPAGQASITETITVTNDAGLEGKENVVVSLSTSPAYTIGWPGKNTVIINDDEPEPLPWVETFTAADGTAVDNGSTSWSASPVTVSYSVLANEMSVSNAKPEAVFKTGVIDISSGTVAVSLSVRGISTDVADDYLRFYKIVDGGPEVIINSTLGQPASSTWTETVSGGSRLELVIRSKVTQKNESYKFDHLSVTGTGVPNPPKVTVTASVASAGEPATPSEFTFSRDGSTSAALIVNYSVGGTANSGSDYVALGTSVTIPAGLTSITKPVSIIDDSVVESSETLIVTLTNNPAYSIVTPGSATVTISDDDVLPVVTVIATDSSASEDPGNSGEFTFYRVGNASAALTVNINVTGTAENGTDYATIGNSVTFPAGLASVTQSVSVANDTAVESSESVTVTLASLASYGIGTNSTATVTILDNDVTPTLPTVTVTASNTATGEPSTTGAFTFNRTGSTSAALTVNFTVSGTATNGVDYATIGTSITIPVGQTSSIQTVSVNNDTTVEIMETVVVTLAGSSGYTLGSPSSATVNIADDDIGLPSPWQTADIGAVSSVGSASVSNGVWTITGSGADIWGTADEFRYVYQSSNGDCSIEARVTSLTNTNGWAKAAVMIRETTATNAQSAMLCITPSNGVSFQYRASTGGSTVIKATVAGTFTAKYLRLRRTGNTFAAFQSNDRSTWTQVGASQNINMGVNTTIGLALTSHVDGTNGTCTMDWVDAKN